MKTIYLAGGCFWGMQKFLDQFSGVLRTEVGYANGPDFAPSYEEVCRSSGHAETVLVEYDEEKLPLEKLLDFYFMVIDPLSYNRQGMDMGVQYRTGVFYTDESQLAAIERVFARETEKAGHKLAVLCEPVKTFSRPRSTIRNISRRTRAATAISRRASIRWGTGHDRRGKRHRALL